MEFSAPHESQLLRRLVFDDCVEEAIGQRVGVSLSADAGESAVEQSRVLQHLPNLGIAPVVRSFLREDVYFEVIVAACQLDWTCVDFVDVNAHHVLSCFLEGVFKGLLILVSLAFSVGNQAVAIP